VSATGIILYIFQKQQDDEDDIAKPWVNRVEDIKMVKKIVCKRLMGEVVFNDSLWQEYSIFFANTCDRIAVNTVFVKGGLQPHDVNINYNTQCHRFSLVISEDEAKCCVIVYFALKKAGLKVHLCAPDSSEPEISLKMSEQVEFLEHWTLETLKMKIPEECKSDINREEICPNVEATGYQDVIKAFEV
jgi:hypothetical protein